MRRQSHGACYCSARLSCTPSPPCSLSSGSTRVSFTVSQNRSALTLNAVLTFLSVSAVSISIDSSLAFYLIGVCNATSAFGRLLSGVLAIRYGGLNIMIIFTTLAAIMTFVWPFVDTHEGFIAIICLYGYACILP